MTKWCLLGVLAVAAGCIEPADAQPVPRPDGGVRRLNRSARANLRILAMMADGGSPSLREVFGDSSGDTREVSGLGTTVGPTGDAGAVRTMAGRSRRRAARDAGARTP